MKKVTCQICGEKFNKDNAGFLESMLSPIEYQRFEIRRKSICIECKEEMLYGGILSVI